MPASSPSTVDRSPVRPYRQLLMLEPVQRHMEADALVLKRLGPPTFARDPAAFTEAMERTYRAIAEHALSLALGDR